MSFVNNLFEGRNAVITGGTAGIGLATAQALHNLGASVVITGRDENRGNDALTSFSEQSRTLFVPGDAATSSGVSQMFERAREFLPSVDILVNCVGGHVGSTAGPLREVTEEDFQAVLAVNVQSAFLTAKQVLPGMSAHGWGRIVFVSSVAGKEPLPEMTAYVAAKHAVNGLAKGLAREVGADGITVNAVCPGTVVQGELRPRPGVDVEWLRQALETTVAKMAIGRALKPSEIADTIVFLCSDAGACITGSQLSVDGGWTTY
jgi:NAD(P)-dependent dehydrogenase (short-subunit alcohol dehydrogenase family)